MIIDIKPIAKPRMTKSDKWKERKCVMVYRAFCDELRLKSAGFKLNGNYKVCFYLPMPKSWSKKKKEYMNGMPHQQRPDLDNLLKSINDALLEEDSIVYRDDASKWWGHEGKIIIKNSKKQNVRLCFNHLENEEHFWERFKKICND